VEMLGDGVETVSEFSYLGNGLNELAGGYDTTLTAYKNWF